MAFTKKTQARILASIKKKCDKLPSCGHGPLSLIDGFMMVGLSDDARVTQCDRSLAMVALVCTECGYQVTLNPDFLGLAYLAK